MATKFTLMLAEGVPPGPVAVMIDGPDEADWMDAEAVPDAFVVDGLPAIVPRLAVKVTAEPTTGAPVFVQRTEIGVAVFTLI